MKLYLVDNYEVSTYSLPNKVEDAFIINYVHYSGKEEAITFIAQDGQWAIQSSPDMQIRKDGNNISEDVVADNTVYNIRFSDLNIPITIYCFDTHQQLFDFAIPSTKTELTIGKLGNFDLVFDGASLNSPELKISKQNNIWVLESNNFKFWRYYFYKRFKNYLVRFIYKNK